MILVDCRRVRFRNASQVSAAVINATAIAVPTIDPTSSPVEQLEDGFGHPVLALFPRAVCPVEAVEFEGADDDSWLDAAELVVLGVFDIGMFASAPCDVFDCEL